MGLATLTRYTVSAGEVVAGVVLLGIGIVHLAAGVPTALLPAIGGIGLIAAAFAVSPPTRGRFRPLASAKEDLLLTSATVAVATVCLLAFVGVAHLS